MDFQVMLLPSKDFWSWIRACSPYVMRFGPNITSNPHTAAAYMAPRQVVTFPKVKNGYGDIGDVERWFQASHPGIRLDVVEAENPSIFKTAMRSRIDGDDRYGQKQRPFFLVWPTDFAVITQGYGAHPEIYSRWDFPGHEGVDFRARPNTNIYACADGEVYRVHTNPNSHPYGLHVRIRHKDGYKTVYAHFAKTMVVVGQHVKAGDIIGKADSTGASVGSHLHLTLKRDGASERGETDYPKDVIDPTPFLIWPDHANTKSLKDYGWTAGKTLFGAHGRVGAPMTEADLEVVSQARLECIKLECCETDETLERLRQSNPDLFIMARLGDDFSAGSITPNEFLRKVEGDVGRFFNQGVRYFELHANPNLESGGWRRSWMSGKDFEGWFMRVAEQLRKSHPGIKIGFPGLSPGNAISGRRAAAQQFVQEAEDAVESADWVGVHCYWTDVAGMQSDGGAGIVAEYRRVFPDKLLFVTEFNNPMPSVRPEVKAQQYLAFMQKIEAIRGLGAAFAYALSSSEGNNPYVWRVDGEDAHPVVNVMRNRSQ